MEQGKGRTCVQRVAAAPTPGAASGRERYLAQTMMRAAKNDFRTSNMAMRDSPRIAFPY